MEANSPKFLLVGSSSFHLKRPGVLELEASAPIPRSFGVTPVQNRDRVEAGGWNFSGFGIWKIWMWIQIQRANTHSRYFDVKYIVTACHYCPWRNYWKMLNRLKDLFGLLQWTSKEPHKSIGQKFHPCLSFIFLCAINMTCHNEFALCVLLDWCWLNLLMKDTPCKGCWNENKAEMFLHAGRKKMNRGRGSTTSARDTGF